MVHTDLPCAIIITHKGVDEVIASVKTLNHTLGLQAFDVHETVAYTVRGAPSSVVTDMLILSQVQ